MVVKRLEVTLNRVFIKEMDHEKHSVGGNEFYQ